MERALDPTETRPAAPGGSDPQAKRWHEKRVLVIRGVRHPESLTPDEVRRVSGMALIGMGMSHRGDAGWPSTPMGEAD